MHSSPLIDNKDKPGQDRDAVFEEVQRELNFRGQTPTDAVFFIGDWTCTYSSNFASWDNLPPDVFRSFFADGAAPGRAVDGTWDQPKDRWKFNEDKSFSDWTYIDPMPEYGIDKPTFSEDRYHVLIRSPDKFVLFNGDGSLIMIYSRAKGAGNQTITGQ